MKKIKFLSLVLTLALIFNITAPVAAPVAHAVESSNGASLQMSDPVTDGIYTIVGAENTNIRFNIVINNADQTGQFAIVNLDSSDYMYEFTFDLSDAITNTSDIDFSAIQAYCFNNENQWREVYLPSAVTVAETDENQIQPFAVDSNATKFEKWLTDKYGSEYSGRLLSTKTQNGIKMYLKSAFQAYSYKDRSYLLSATMTVVGFVTSVLGLSSGATAVSVIGAITGAGGLLTMGNSVHKYVVRANWFKYATVVRGTGYPYGLADKSPFYDGYVYTGTGTCNVDEASASTSYVPSSTVYTSNTNIYNNAFNEYSRIGFQEGNF